MVKTTVTIDGMMCGMCESHIADTIRKTFPNAKKVSASHTKHRAEFVTDEPVDERMLREAIDGTGYTFVSATEQPYEKRGLFHR